MEALFNIGNFVCLKEDDSNQIYCVLDLSLNFVKVKDEKGVIFTIEKSLLKSISVNDKNLSNFEDLKENIFLDLR